ncbi:UDP-2,4-diacetamido-2,4,6-trideoxy-beta-L-altropyranose hydrolase [Cohnella cholangitidis]|uniref:UDP-2,4-diacetamido-2,4, 6-trideoxy-beta-L-altropyranose hydrolase n=1 Tax=Cohnella cholangitidis TaxID=2598458 RepID=A0A7G5BXH7_9BACL|nr:UDP-2,4-diacetamido-2,4,6-trideoxy-beta-L-altropyranose hydrolase [Cohnella cholangitidis]QMV41661.1 UDP-2,4-diacetamido-2,4,6-trideoxy-beta-L-altropyranose hydrolase [Cohnella cholangitidis]
MMIARKAFIRADASLAIGTGHVMRCLVIADGLKREGFEVSFICRETEGNMDGYIESRGFAVFRLPMENSPDQSDTLRDAEFTIQIIANFPETPDWLIVDHYGIDKKWESVVKPFVGRMLIIDDLANRPHIGDMLLDQNISDPAKNRYGELVPEKCIQLLGPRYLLLKPSFYEARRTLRTRNGKMNRLLVFFGGSDPTNETAKALDALQSMDLAFIKVDIVIGQINNNRAVLEQRCGMIPNIELHVQVENMDEFIVRADFALGSGGVAMWERCYLGLPSAVTIVADNQIEGVRLAELSESVWNMGWHEQINSDHYADILLKALTRPQDLIKLGMNGLALMDSRPETAYNRVLEALLGEI